ncbi:MAG: SIR2 family protein [Gammaproteobacteria bacterium]
MVIIVGSGLSCAEGLPGMGDLGAELIRRIGDSIDGNAEQATWNDVCGRLESGTALESALHNVPLSSDLERIVVEVTAAFIQRSENEVLADCLNTDRHLRFERLLPHLSLSPSQPVEVVTTNYDRLIEYATEAGGWGIDTGFVGRWLGHHDPHLSSKSFIEDIASQGKTTRVRHRPRIRLYKPHGSLDWYDSVEGAISTTLTLSARRLLITPGVGKYFEGYKPPFDAHREGANAAIDKAAAFLCLGYGFNDDHLQTHLEPRLRSGVPTLLLTYGLTDGAKAMLNTSPQTTALVNSADSLGTDVMTMHGTENLPGVQWWDLEHFIKGVLEP